MRLASWFEKNATTQQAFADKIGKSQGYVSQLIAGTVWPSRETWEKIALATAGQVTPNDYLVLGRRRRSTAKRAAA